MPSADHYSLALLLFFFFLSTYMENLCKSTGFSFRSAYGEYIGYFLLYIHELYAPGDDQPEICVRIKKNVVITGRVCNTHFLTTVRIYRYWNGGCVFWFKGLRLEASDRSLMYSFLRMHDVTIRSFWELLWLPAHRFIGNFLFVPKGWRKL